MTLPPKSLVLSCLQEVVLPAGGTAALLALVVVFLLPRRYWPMAAVFVVGCGFAAGNHFKAVAPWLPDNRRIEWLAMLVGVLAVGSALTRLTFVPPTWSVAGLAGFVALAAGRLIPKEFSPFFAAAFFTLCTLCGLSFARLARRDPGPLVPGLMMVLLLMAGGVLIHAHSARYLDFAMLVAVPCGVVMLWALLRSFDTGSIYPAAMLAFHGILFLGYHEATSKVPMLAYLILAFAPLLPSLVHLPPFRSFVGKKLALVLLGPALIFAIIALSLAAINDPIDFADFENL
ncbi:MAG: hypothetical protein ACRCZF_09920 [Gemmataceae bacterium]